MINKGYGTIQRDRFMSKLMFWFMREKREDNENQVGMVTLNKTTE